MDTNDLSRETHIAIIDTAEEFHHDLTLQFGVMASDCTTDNEFLNESESLINNWIDNLNSEYLIEDIFFDNPPNSKDLKLILYKILENISKVRQIPLDKRKFDLW